MLGMGWWWGVYVTEIHPPPLTFKFKCEGIIQWILRDTYRWVKLSKPLSDGG